MATLNPRAQIALVLAQIERVFNNKRTDFVKTVITIKHGEVINRRIK